MSRLLQAIEKVKVSGKLIIFVQGEYELETDLHGWL